MPVGVLDGVNDGSGVKVGGCVPVGVLDGVNDGSGVKVGGCVPVGVLDGVNDGSGVKVGGCVPVGVLDGVNDGSGVKLGSGVKVAGRVGVSVISVISMVVGTRASAVAVGTVGVAVGRGGSVGDGGRAAISNPRARRVATINPCWVPTRATRVWAASAVTNRRS